MGSEDGRDKHHADITPVKMALEAVMKWKPLYFIHRDDGN